MQEKQSPIYADGVPENKSNEERISMSFNTFSLGTLGTKADLTYLNVKELIKDRNDENT